MPLSLEDVAKLAKLARIKVSQDELTATCDQLNNIFALVATMQSINTDGVEPMAHPQDVPLRLREDVVTQSNQREAFQSLAPQVENGLFLVPKVIE